jgi:CHAT domain-containing protein/tetratricopeptide (TPR) repeat protein
VSKADFAAATRLLDALETRSLSRLERARWHQLRASVQADTGRTDNALRSLDEAERLAVKPDDAALLAQIARVRGGVWRDRGASLQAIAHLKDGLKWAERAGEPRLVASLYTSLATAYQSIGDWSRALDYTERAFEATPNPNDAARFNYLINRGIAAFEFNDRDRAERSFREALVLAQATQNQWSLSLANGELGMVYQEFDRDWDRALGHFEQAISIARAIRVPALETSWVNNSARIFRDTGRLDDALAGFHRALALERQGGQGRNAPMVLKNIGQVLRMQGRLGEAETWLLQARDEADRQNVARFRWESRMELGRLFTHRDAGRAERYFAESIDLLEATHSNVLLESFRAGALSLQLTAYNPYDLYVELLLDRGDTAGAFLVAERARARAFLDTLSLAREEIGSAVPPDFVQAENALLQQISTRQAALRRDQLSGADLDGARSELEALEGKLTTLRVRLATDTPAVAQARYPRLWPAEAVQREILGRDETLLLFYVGRSSSAVWVVQSDGFEVIRLPARETIEGAVREYLDSIATPAASADRAAARALAAMLMPDLDSRLPDGSRLIVVPHGILHHVPFEALADASQRYLIEKYVVSYAPSVSSLAYLRRPQTARARGRQVVAVGNPVAPSGPPSTERAFQIDWVRDLRPLPHTAEELQQIATIFGRRARLLEQEAANEVTLAQSLENVGALHFATHALVDEDQPDRSGLALTARTPDSDGILQMREIYRLRLPGALVTLSACRTALGQRLIGEGVIGLARAFFYAGADTVVASLWNVNDAATAQWMGSFYQAIHDGEPVDGAVRAAKLRFIQSETALEHPFYWAGFIATGHAATRLEVGSSRATRFAILALAIAGMAIGGAIALKARAKRRTAAATTVSSAHRAG